MNTAYISIEIPGLKVRRGKVRDVFDLGDKLLLIATDRISAFDWVLPTPIPDKGRALNLLSEHWFGVLGQRHHCLSTDINEVIRYLPSNALRNIDRDSLAGRCMLVEKTVVFPVECVVRGYLEGSGLKEYRQTGKICGIELPAGLQQCSKLPEPIFTPATKEETGHDINITFEQMCDEVGNETAEDLRERSLRLYNDGAVKALKSGIIIADTKFEFGRLVDTTVLIDEVFTSDSSRFWPADQYQPGRAQVSVDKQHIRELLDATKWDKNSPPPALPADIVAKTREKYIQAYERLTGKSFPWK